MTNSIRTIFFGTEDFSVASLQALIEHGFDVAAVVTKPDFKSGRGRKLQTPEVAHIANDNRIRVFQPDKIAEIEPELKALGPDIGTLAAYGKILPKSTIELFPHGIVNVHPSLLPKHRGPSPIVGAILNSDDKTGVTLMQLAEAMDAGGIYSVEEVQMKGSETGPKLTEHLSQIGARMLVRDLPDIVSGKLKAEPQNEDDATYTKLIKKTDGKIDWQKTATEIERQIRAYSGWPGSYTNIANYDVTITTASIVKADGAPGNTFKTDDGNLGVYCSQDALRIDELIPQGKNTIGGKDFINGYRII